MWGSTSVDHCLEVVIVHSNELCLFVGQDDCATITIQLLLITILLLNVGMLIFVHPFLTALMFSQPLLGGEKWVFNLLT